MDTVPRPFNEMIKVELRDSKEEQAYRIKRKSQKPKKNMDVYCYEDFNEDIDEDNSEAGRKDSTGLNGW